MMQKTALSRPMAMLCLATSMALVGSYVTLSKPLVAAIPVFILAWLRFAIGALAMWRWLPAQAQEPSINTSTHRLIFFESFFGNFLFSICMLWGVSLSNATLAGVILAGMPVTVALMSRLFLREHLTLRAWLAVVLAVMGIGSYAWMEWQQSAISGSDLQTAQLNSSDSLWGALLIVGAMLCEATYVIIGKKLSAQIRPKRIAALINLWGLVLMTPLALWTLLSQGWTPIELPMWGLLVFYALAASVWTVALWMKGLQGLHAHEAGVFTIFLPLTAAGFGVVFLNETMSLNQLLAFGVALASVVLISFRQAAGKTSLLDG